MRKVKKSKKHCCDSRKRSSDCEKMLYRYYSTPPEEEYVVLGWDNEEVLFMDLIGEEVAGDPETFRKWLDDTGSDEGPVLVLNKKQAASVGEVLRAWAEEDLSDRSCPTWPGEEI